MRAKTFNRHLLEFDSNPLERAEMTTIYTEHVRPLTRGECPEARPCPWVSCRHHLYLDVTRRHLKLNHPDIEPGDMRDSCSLDLAERGGMTLEEIGWVMNLTRERIRQIELSVIDKIRDEFPELAELLWRRDDD